MSLKVNLFIVVVLSTGNIMSADGVDEGHGSLGIHFGALSDRSGSIEIVEGGSKFSGISLRKKSDKTTDNSTKSDVEAKPLEYQSSNKKKSKALENNQPASEDGKTSKQDCPATASQTDVMSDGLETKERNESGCPVPNGDEEKKANNKKSGQQPDVTITFDPVEKENDARLDAVQKRNDEALERVFDLLDKMDEETEFPVEFGISPDLETPIDLGSTDDEFWE
ncbi:MAG: hypothetical protein F4044_04640 [Rhodobacteraceae bacterium]|nr:hypothetical protein [Paracoccaceae bacterium]